MPVRKKYTDKQKLAYYKKKASMKPRRYIRGRGAYTKPKSSGKWNYHMAGMGSTLGATAGGALGTLLGGPAGTAIGAGLGSLAGAYLMGKGSYNVRRNSLMISEGESPARMHSNNANTRVRHREYICDIVSSSSANTFSLQNFEINPGLFTTFPWLSAVAQQYQEWVPRGIVFEFKTLSADAIASSTNNTLGGIIMATNYNAAAGNFANKQAMDNTEYTTSCKPSESFYHAIECEPRANVLSELYVRNGAVPSGQDQKTFDLGNFQIASFGIQGTSVVLGELWVSFDIELRKPISTAAQGLDVLSDHFRLASVTNSAPLGTASVLQANSSIGGTISANGQTYNFNPLLQEGSYLMVWQVKGSSTVITDPTTTFTNCSAVAIWNNGASSTVGCPPSASTTTVMSIYAIVNITAANAAINFSGAGTLPASVTTGDLVITQWDSQIVL